MDIIELTSHRTMSQTRQSVWTVRRTYRADNGRKMRVNIHHDPYEFQAYAVLEFLSETNFSWHQVHTLPTEDWYESLNVLFIKDLTAEHHDTIDFMCESLVKIGEDLLS